MIIGFQNNIEQEIAIDWQLQEGSRRTLLKSELPFLDLGEFYSDYSGI